MVLLLVNKSDVPLYLRNGELYSALLGSKDSLTVPSDSFKISPAITKFEDVRALLSTLAFWKVSVPPPSLVHYCVKQCSEEDKFLAVFSEFKPQLLFLQFLEKLMDHLCFSSASENNDVIFLWSDNEQENAIKICGQQFYMQKGVVWNAKTTAFAAKRNLPKTLAFLHELGCPWDDSTCTAAVKADSVECLRYAHERGCPWSGEALHAAASAGHSACIQYAVTNKCPGVANVCVDFAGNVESLRAAHAAGCPLSPECYQGAACSLASVRYLREQGVTWHKDTCTRAAMFGNAAALQYAHEHGAPWCYDTARTCAYWGRLECLMYAVKNGCPTTQWCSPSLCCTAASTGELDCLVYLHENGFPWSCATCTHAAKSGSLACLRYLHENACPWDRHTTEAAAKGKSLACLRYAHEHGCPWDYRVLECADGETKVYAYLHHCPPFPNWKTAVCVLSCVALAMGPALLCIWSRR